MAPFKLLFRSKADGSKYGVVAESINHLKEKAIKKFQLSCEVEDVILKLEDGTIVDDEDYFACLESNTCVVVSEPKTSSDTVDGRLQVDGPLSYPSSSGEYCSDSVSLGEHIDITRLTRRLHSDITSIGLFSIPELEAIANATQEDLRQSLTYMTCEEIDSLQDVCHTHLVEREKTTEAIVLLKLCDDNQPLAPKRLCIRK